MRRLTLKQLQTVRAVAESGTIATAADILRVTPAALTARIKLLEGDVGLAFFDRAGGRLRLTDAGQEVVNTTIRMEMLLVELGNTLAAIKGQARRAHRGRHHFDGQIFRHPARRGLLEAESSHRAAAGDRQSAGDDPFAARLCHRHRADGPAADRLSGDQPGDRGASPGDRRACRSSARRASRTRQGRSRKRELHHPRGGLRHTHRVRLFLRRRSGASPAHQVRDRLQRDDQAGGDGGGSASA